MRQSTTRRGTEDPITNNLYVWYDDTNSGCAKGVTVCTASSSTAQELPVRVPVSDGAADMAAKAITEFVGKASAKAGSGR